MHDTISRVRDEVAGLAAAALEDGAGAIPRLLGDVEAVVARALAGSRGAGEPPPACHAGCDTCCRINVATLAIEGAAAAAWLRARLAAPDAAALAARLAAFHDRVRWLEDRERIALGLACPLLDAAGACTIHPVRPLVCRSVSSIDADDCRRALDARASDEPGLVRMHLLQRALYLEALAALGDALDGRGLDARTRDVSGMTAAFLADPALAVALLRGARVPLE